MLEGSASGSGQLALAALPDGTRAANLLSGRLSLWDPAREGFLGTLEGHQVMVRSWCRASNSEDRSFRLWATAKRHFLGECGVTTTVWTTSSLFQPQLRPGLWRRGRNSGRTASAISRPQHWSHSFRYLVAAISPMHCRSETGAIANVMTHDFPSCRGG